MSEVSGRENVSPLMRKLKLFMDLSESEVAALQQLRTGMTEFAADTDIIAFGDPYSDIHVVEKGWAIRHTATATGDRVITSFVLPGDFICLHAPLYDLSDHTVTTITPVSTAKFSTEQFLAMMRDQPRLALAIAWCTAKEESLLQEHLLSVAKRTAYARLAHLLTELWQRLTLLQLTQDGTFPLPVTQQELADGLGLSLWYVNRTMRALHDDGLIAIVAPGERYIRILDEEGLIAAAGFEDEFLHFSQIPARTARLFDRRSGIGGAA